MRVLVVVGTRKTLAYAVQNVTATKRNTLLRERLESFFRDGTVIAENEGD